MKYIIASILLLSSIFLSGQNNLVPNPDFEQYYSCPNSVEQLNRVKYWFSSRHPKNSEEYFNACCKPTPYFTYGIPKNNFGEQWPHSDSGYVGFIFYYYNENPLPPVNNYREYIQVKLTDTLKKGCEYCVSFFVSPADNATIGVKQIGAFLSSDTIFPPPGEVLIDTSAQVEYSGLPIEDTLVWTEVSGTFIAKGDEAYIALGNFNSDANTDTVIYKNKFHSVGTSYYYLDDVSVYYCGPDTTNKPEPVHFIRVYPNPAINELIVEFFNIDFEGSAITFYDMLGRMVGKTALSEYEEGKALVNLTDLASGTYIYRVTTSGWWFKRGKVVVL